MIFHIRCENACGIIWSISESGYRGGKKWKDPKEWIITENSHEKCIDDDTATKIKLQLEKNKGNRNNPGTKRYLLTDIIYCGDCGTRMVGNSGYYSCQNKNRNNKACSNSNIKADFLDKQILIYLKENLIKKEFYEKFIKTIKSQYEKFKKESLKDQEKHHKRIKELDHQISRLMKLFSRGKIKAEIIENEIDPLQHEKEELETKIGDLLAIDEILDVKVDEFSSESIKCQLDRFEDMLNDDNRIEMRSLVRDFIYRITLHPKENPKSKKWKRHVHLDSYVRALTMIKLASPRGFEPLLPA